MADFRDRDNNAQTLQELQGQVASLGLGNAATVAPEDDAPTLSAMPEVVEELLALGAPDGLSPDQTKLSLNENAHDRRYQVSLTVKGPYPVIRKFILDALALRPGARLDEISISRQNAAEPVVEAAMTVSFALRDET